ncbi:hypothetical protein PLESTF_000271200 [Pleodorina starrii]|nr:hypothetical protein PLESTM_001222200 [Pleodorina starrii]GLC65274.1 hypothetical protein PLESTF_000271200 [Pleodorina starrii]
MASRVAAEVAADAVLIGRYFGHPTTTSALSRAVAAVGTAAASSSRSTAPVAEGDGPGVRMMASSSSSSGAMMSGMSAAGGAVRFMSMSLFGRKTAGDEPLVSSALAAANSF